MREIEESRKVHDAGRVAVGEPDQLIVNENFIHSAMGPWHTAGKLFVKTRAVNLSRKFLWSFLCVAGEEPVFGFGFSARREKVSKEGSYPRPV